MTDTRTNEHGRVLLVRRQGQILTLLYSGNRLLLANASGTEETVLDNIYIAKVKSIAQNIQAAFVEYAPKKLGFLPLKECSAPIVTNRSYDGRLVAGDEVVIQITAESQKTKEANADTNLSFAGKYLVLSLEKKQVGYSARLSEAKKRELKECIQESSVFAEAGKAYGIILRTNTEEISDFSILETELQALKQEAEQVLKNAESRTCFSCLKRALPSYLKALQDLYTGDYEKIITDDAALYEETKEYLSRHQEADLEKLCFYEDELLPLSTLYSVESRLAEALDRKVWMRSGAYLVIDRAEALTCIDVNTGKFSGKKSRTETFFQINMEAAEEIGRQLRLRNLSGIIIIDFINMDRNEQKKALMKHLREVLSLDPVKTVVVDMTPLGLVEVTRKKEKRSLWEQLQTGSSKA